MMKCPACSTDNLAGASFCSACGHRLDALPGALLPPRPKRRWILVAFVLLAIGVVVFLVTRPSELEPNAPAPGGPLSAGPEAKAVETERRLAVVVAALDKWLQQHMSYPELAELLVRDDYLKPAAFDDAWGRRIDYTRLDSMHYRLCSRGLDNLPKTDDDICLGGRP